MPAVAVQHSFEVIATPKSSRVLLPLGLCHQCTCMAMHGKTFTAPNCRMPETRRFGSINRLIFLQYIYHSRYMQISRADQSVSIDSEHAKLTQQRASLLTSTLDYRSEYALAMKTSAGRRKSGLHPIPVCTFKNLMMMMASLL